MEDLKQTFVLGWDLQGVHVKNLKMFELWETDNIFPVSLSLFIEVLIPISHQNTDERAKHEVICIKNNLIPDIYLYNYFNKCRHFFKVAFPYCGNI